MSIKRNPKPVFSVLNLSFEKLPGRNENSLGKFPQSKIKSLPTHFKERLGFLDNIMTEQANLTRKIKTSSILITRKRDLKTSLNKLMQIVDIN